MSKINQKNNHLEPEKKLRTESISTKIVVEIIIFLVVVVLTRLFNFRLPHQTGLSWNISLALSFALIFFLISRHRKSKNLPLRKFYIVENIVDTLMMSHLLFLFGHINGPLFFFYGFVIMEAALNLDRIIPFFIAGTAALAMGSEFLFLISQHSITLDLSSGLFFILRIAFLFLMARYSHTLAGVVVEAKQKTKQIGKQMLQIQEQSKKIEKQTKDITALSEMKSEFLKVVNHQLRTPVSIIKGMASMLHEGGMTPREQKDYKRKLYLSSERLSIILDDILTAQALVGGKPPAELKPCDITELIESQIDHLTPQAKEKKIKVLFKKPKQPLTNILVDPPDV